MNNQSLSMSLENGESRVIQGRFHLLKKLGAGSFGEIFEALDLKTKKIYACKAESLRTKHPQLRLEYQIYRELSRSENFVRVWGFVQHYQHQVMIMDKLGDSLEQLFTMCGRRFSIKCVCMIALQIISRIEELHNHNYLHRDIKPDNFLIGAGDCTGKEGQKVYMIDLGLGKVWKEHDRHIPEKHGKRLIGTPRYASIKTHFGYEQSRRDDLESLGYMLMYFAIGHLPWQGLRGATKEEKYQKIGHKKRDTSLENLCRGYPDEFKVYLQRCQNLKFTEVPPYEEFRNLFRRILDRLGVDNDSLFDWNHHRYNKSNRAQLNNNKSNRISNPNTKNKNANVAAVANVGNVAANGVVNTKQVNRRSRRQITQSGQRQQQPNTTHKIAQQVGHNHLSPNQKYKYITNATNNNVNQLQQLQTMNNLNIGQQTQQLIPIQQVFNTTNANNKYATNNITNVANVANVANVVKQANPTPNNNNNNANNNNNNNFLNMTDLNRYHCRLLMNQQPTTQLQQLTRQSSNHANHQPPQASRPRQQRYDLNNNNNNYIVQNTGNYQNRHNAIANMNSLQQLTLNNGHHTQHAQQVSPVQRQRSSMTAARTHHQQQQPPTTIMNDYKNLLDNYQQLERENEHLKKKEAQLKKNIEQYKSIINKKEHQIQQITANHAQETKVLRRKITSMNSKCEKQVKTISDLNANNNALRAQNDSLLNASAVSRPSKRRKLNNSSVHNVRH